MINHDQKKGVIRLKHFETHVLQRITLRVPVEPKRTGEIPACTQAWNMRERTAQCPKS